MTGEEMIKYLDDPNRLNEYSLSELRALLRKYPYFHTAHLLFLLNLKNINDPRYKEFLKQSAVHIKDRDKFVRLVNHLYVDKSATGEAPGRGEHEKEEKGDQPVPAEQETEDNQTPERRKEKDFSTRYLRNRISETLSEQKGDKNKEKDASTELDSDFFIIDKVSQVEEKMTRRLREQYEKQQREQKDQNKSREGKKSTGDSFELEKTDDNNSDRQEEHHPPSRGLGGAYFSEKEYRKYRETSRKQQDDLIEHFIKKAPELENITPSEKENKDISESSVEEREDIASERLIKVYVQQGYYNKAIDAYHKLSLKYPEKSDYFAEQIKKLRKNINKQKK
jgi:hypothetical protein